MIKVCKRYHFAGENVTEVVEVPEDSPDAKKWPVWQSLDEMEASAPEGPISPPSSENHPNSAPPTESPSNPPAPAPSGKRPGPRKTKTRLPELPGRSSTTAKKLTTLDKSVMDWKAHVQSSENEVLHDELEANRRGGGYLEKVEFLQRVDERKDAILDAANTSKRKRG
ncbi:hypothetical protein M378DRAFT_665629 [Amanita muscaria Koide BX008]|uniref:SWR1-complex protein 5 n=1 Tax=Amanita muscaria (strain Koide BX008) TaxID=946122 RepID=A0A0C2SK24_AMAMK|nr:hypothetical protein M378DRAFT_665629 [Amanita muscaria Koide BX008]